MDREEREARTNRLRGCAEIDVVTLADDVLALDAELRATRAALATAEAERDRLRNIVDVVACATPPSASARATTPPDGARSGTARRRLPTTGA